MVLNNGNFGYFMDINSGMKKHIVFEFEKMHGSKHSDRGQIIAILMHEIYVIVVFEIMVAIFNSETGEFLEEQGLLDRFRYRAACLNHHTGDIMLVAHTTSKATNVSQTKVCQLKEIPAQDQIDYLLANCRIREANEIFNLKVNKYGDFNAKQNQFQLDIGWIYLTKKLNFSEMMVHLKNSDQDPRELILMFDKSLLTNFSTEMLKKHFNATKFDFDIDAIIDRFMFENDQMSLNKKKKIEELRRVVIEILEHKNQQLAPDLKKGQTKSAKFQYSKFSPFAGLIKQKEAVSQVDIVSFIQTHLIKIYIQRNDKEAIQRFFSNSNNRRQFYLDFKEIEPYLRMSENIEICSTTKALIKEFQGNYKEALDHWKQLKTEEGCKRTVAILKKPQITNKDMIFEYLEWVLEKSPEVGLSIFLERITKQGKNSNSEGSSARGPQSYGGGTNNSASSNQMGGAIEDLSHDEILQNLQKIEMKQFKDIDDLLEGQKKEFWSKVYMYQERYLEHIVDYTEFSDRY